MLQLRKAVTLTPYLPSISVRNMPLPPLEHVHVDHVVVVYTVLSVLSLPHVLPSEACWRKQAAHCLAVT